jgi:hypothetical protein
MFLLAKGADHGPASYFDSGSFEHVIDAAGGGTGFDVVRDVRE